MALISTLSLSTTMPSSQYDPQTKSVVKPPDSRLPLTDDDIDRLLTKPLNAVWLETKRAIFKDITDIRDDADIQENYRRHSARRHQQGSDAAHFQPPDTEQRRALLWMSNQTCIYWWPKGTIAEKVEEALDRMNAVVESMWDGLWEESMLDRRVKPILKRFMAFYEELETYSVKAWIDLWREGMGGVLMEW